tara:strand:- start:1732 stop:1977 length:246 start_codon:yes stop_codon:yes gene_type:complete
MPLSEDDLKAIGTLMREEITDAFERRLTPFEAEVREFRNEVNGRFDHLFKQEETREQEALVISKQLDDLDERVGALENKIA